MRIIQGFTLMKYLQQPKERRTPMYNEEFVFFTSMIAVITIIVFCLLGIVSIELYLNKKDNCFDPWSSFQENPPESTSEIIEIKPKYSGN